MDPELYSMPAWFRMNWSQWWACGYQMFAHLLRDLDGLAMIIFPVLGPHLRINALWYQEFLLKAVYRAAHSNTQRG